MPRLNGDMETHKLNGNFGFTGTRIKRLGASEYTLVTIAIDVTGSMSGHEGEAMAMLLAAIEACRKSPRSENLLVRTLIFHTGLPGGIQELHGFKPLGEIDPNDYQSFRAGGLTNLNDACYSGIGAMNGYARQLSGQDFLVNGITFIITDGGENASVATMDMVRQEARKAVTGEFLESHVSVLIGVDSGYSAAADLQKFQQEASIDKFIDAGKVTKGTLAKLAEFVSRSISSTSQALGTGGPSQQIAATI